MLVRELVAGHELDVAVRPVSAAIYAPAIREHLNRLRREGWPVPNEAWEDLADLERVAAAVREERAVARRRDSAGTVATAVKNGASATMEPMELSVPQAAELLGVRRQSVQGRIDRGTLPARKDADGRWLIRRENLDA